MSVHHPRQVTWQRPLNERLAAIPVLIGPRCTAGHVRALRSEYVARIAATLGIQQAHVDQSDAVQEVISSVWNDLQEEVLTGCLNWDRVWERHFWSRELASADVNWFTDA